jgi:hypothetical protein
LVRGRIRHPYVATPTCKSLKIMKKIFAIVVAVFAFSYANIAWSEPSPSFNVFMAGVTNFSSGTVGFATNGTPLVSTAAPVFTAASGGGAVVTTAADVAVGASKASVLVKGAATGAAVFTAAKSLAGGWPGLVLAGAALLPVVIDWLRQGNVKVAPAGAAKPFLIDDPSVCSVAPCTEYRVDDSEAPAKFFSSSAAACNAYLGAHSASPEQAPYSFALVSAAGGCSFSITYNTGGSAGSGYRSYLSQSSPPSAQGGLPASMDDIAPYMNKVPTSPAMIAALLAAGASIPITPTDVIAPPSVSNPVIDFNTVILGLPSTTDTTYTPGNPQALSPGVFTTAQIGNGYRDVRVDGVPQFTGGSMSTSLAGSVVPIPTNTTTTSSFNPNTNQTTTTKTTNYPGATVTQSVASTTQLTGTTASTSGTAVLTGATTSTVTTTVKDPGGSIISNTVGTDTSTRAVTPAPAPAPAEKSITCGLPGTPACKIDETGTPADPKLDAEKKSTDVLKPLKDFAANPTAALPSLPSLNWAFRLPSGCTAISLPAFAPYLQAIDICPFTSMFHDIMSVVWVLGGLFGAIGTFWRNVFSQA